MSTDFRPPDEVEDIFDGDVARVRFDPQIAIVRQKNGVSLQPQRGAGIIGGLRRGRPTAAGRFGGEMQAGTQDNVVVVAAIPRRADERRVHFLRPESDGVERVAFGGDGADTRLVLELVVDPRQGLFRSLMHLETR